MKFFRLMAITVLLLACVVLGSACAGANGEQGPKGDTGATGAQGLQGIQGIQGVKGDTGDQGPQGIQGLQGLQGIQGVKGDTGLPGIGVEWVGEWDSSVLYGKYDGVGYQGSSYISRQPNNTNNLPTDTNWWDLWVEKGDTGEQGIQGIQGAKGDSGAQGIQGIQGEKGDTGDAGPSMMVAMGVVGQDGSLLKGYNVTSSELDSNVPAYTITLTGINYNHLNYVTQVTPHGPFLFADYSSYSGDLIVFVCSSSGGATVASFSFMVLEVP